MPTQGPNSATSVGSVTRGGSDIEWTNPEYATGSDDDRASVVLVAYELSSFLWATDFRFTIPRWATVDGILAEFQVSCPSAIPPFEDIVGIVRSGVQQGSTYETYTSLPAVEAYWEYGGAADTWNAYMTPWDVNDPTSGLMFGIDRDAGAGSCTSYVNDIRETVTYTTHGGPYRRSRRGPCPRGQAR